VKTGDAFFGEEADWGVDDSDVPEVKTKPRRTKSLSPSSRAAQPGPDYGSDSTDRAHVSPGDGSVPLLSREEEVTIAKEIETVSTKFATASTAFRSATATSLPSLTASRPANQPRDIFPTRPKRKSSVERDEKRSANSSKTWLS